MIGRYVVAGGINTSAGLINFFLLFRVMQLTPLWANVITYAIGLVLAYFLNSRFVFRSTTRSPWIGHKFLAAFVISFALNLASLQILLVSTNLAPEIAHMASLFSRCPPSRTKSKAHQPATAMRTTESEVETYSQLEQCCLLLKLPTVPTNKVLSANRQPRQKVIFKMAQAI